MGNYTLTDIFDNITSFTDTGFEVVIAISGLLLFVLIFFLIWNRVIRG